MKVPDFNLFSEGSYTIIIEEGVRVDNISELFPISNIYSNVLNLYDYCQNNNISTIDLLYIKEMETLLTLPEYLLPQYIYSEIDLTDKGYKLLGDHIYKKIIK